MRLTILLIAFAFGAGWLLGANLTPTRDGTRAPTPARAPRPLPVLPTDTDVASSRAAGPTGVSVPLPPAASRLAVLVLDFEGLRRPHVVVRRLNFLGNLDENVVRPPHDGRPVPLKVAPGRVEVRRFDAERVRSLGTVLDLEPGARVVVRLADLGDDVAAPPGYGVVTGRVSTLDGTPLAHYAVRIDGGEEPAALATRRNGVFSTVLLAGRYELECGGIRRTIDVAAGRQLSLDLKPEDAGEIQVAGLKASLTRLRAPGASLQSWQVRGDGVITFVPPGVYDVFIPRSRMDRGGTFIAGVQVVAGRRTKIARPAGTLVVRAPRRSARPRPRFKLFDMRQPDDVGAVMEIDYTKDEWTARARNLRPGLYRLEAKLDGARHVREIRVGPDKTVDLMKG